MKSYLYLGLLGATAVSIIAGVVLLFAAVAFEGYIAALMVMALGGCTYAAARELKARQARTPESRGEA